MPQDPAPKESGDAIPNIPHPVVNNAVDKYGPWMLVTKQRRARRVVQTNAQKDQDAAHATYIDTNLGERPEKTEEAPKNIPHKSITDTQGERHPENREGFLTGSQMRKEKASKKQQNDRKEDNPVDRPHQVPKEHGQKIRVSSSNLSQQSNSVDMEADISMVEETPLSM